MDQYIKNRGEEQNKENEQNINLIDIDDNFMLNFLKSKDNIKSVEKVDDTEYIIGIDLGTTNSCCSVYKNNQIEIISDEKGNKYIPSYVGFTNINKYVGYDAKNQSVINSDNVYYEIKRLIGLKFSDQNVQREKEFLSYKYIGDDNDNIRLLSTLGYGDLKTFSPEEISANVLMKMKHMASTYLKKTVNKAVITIPARFTDAQRQATHDAATIAGLEVVRMIHEPTAASIAYGLANRKLETDEVINVLVYDFGGGTLDVSIVEITVDENNQNIFTVLGSAGNTHMGGADFDNKLVGFSLNKFKQKYGLQNLNGLSSLSMQKLKQSCENAKKILSTKSKTYISIENFYDNKNLLFALTRNDLEIICSDLLLICLKPIDDVLEACDIDINDIHEIILVGGMTRMPSIVNRIEMKFRKKPNLSLNPDEAISIGAGYQGAILSGILNPHTDNLTLLDITPLSLGVEIVGGIMDVLIDRNTIIPYSITKTYTTDSDYENSVVIKIFEGERTLTVDNIFVGEFELTGIEEAPRGIPKIDVTFSIDVNGIVTVTAEDTKKQEKSTIIVNSNKGRLSKQEILKLIEEAKELEIRDEIERRKKMMHYQLDDLCSNILANLNNSHFKLSDHNKNVIKNDVTVLIDWLKDKKYYERTDEELENTLENIKKRYGTLIVRGVLEKDSQIKSIDDNKGTNIYSNENDENIDLDDENKIINIIENEENQVNISEEELNELKKTRKELFDLCYSIFDIICNENFVIDQEHCNELKDFIDDTLLWAHVHDKPTKAEYKLKIDEVNEACDKIINEYESNNKQIFSENELSKNSNNPKSELENMAFTIKILCDEKKTFLKTDQINKLNVKLDEVFELLYEKENGLEETYKEKFNEFYKEKLDEFYKEKLDEFNIFCQDLYNELSGINFDVNVINSSNIILNETESTSGTDIETLLKIRQEEQIRQLLIDSNNHED
jgi:molecular chaperone DnaK (HSP70)